AGRARSYPARSSGPARRAAGNRLVHVPERYGLLRPGKDSLQVHGRSSDADDLEPVVADDDLELRAGPDAQLPPGFGGKRDLSFGGNRDSHTFVPNVLL